MITDDLATLVREAILTARDTGEFSLSEENITVAMDTPRNKQHGDYSSNIALTLKKATGLNDSRDIATRLLRHLPAGNRLIEKVEIAGPGFLNFYLKPDYRQRFHFGFRECSSRHHHQSAGHALDGQHWTSRSFQRGRQRRERRHVDLRLEFRR